MMSEQELLRDKSLENEEDIELREAVWDLADAIFESGRYPTRNDICSQLKKSPKTIGSHFADWRNVNPRSALTVQNRGNGNINNHGNGSASNGGIHPADRESELAAARDVVTRHYSQKTKNFRTPGLQEQVNQALEQIDEYALSQQPSPLEVLDWLMNGNQQDAQNQQ